MQSFSKYFSDPIDKTIFVKTHLVGNRETVNKTIVWDCTVVLFGGSGGWFIVSDFLWYLPEVSYKNGFINRVRKMLRKSDTMNHPPNKTTVQSQLLYY